MSIINHSINVILNNQGKGGAYIACPTFPTYHYCWLRDGSFIAHAMDRVGHYDSAEKYFRWVGNTLKRYGNKVDTLEAQLRSGTVPDRHGILNTRFTLDGLEENTESDWGNFQIDGYGTWLWALAEHVQLSGDTSLLQELSAPILVTLRYLELVWMLPNYDCWEEHPEYIHPYSLAAVFSGFDSIASLIRTGQMDASKVDVVKLAEKVKEFLTKYAVHEGRLVKHIHPSTANKPARPVKESGVDSSLIAVAVPYRVLSPDSQFVESTIQAIEAELHRPEGGVYRYGADVFYGGGEWILLTAWLGWYYAQNGKIQQAESLRTWIESQVDTDGNLAEQMSEHTLAPKHFEPWKKNWGPVANPLLWSHAMYILLAQSIEESKNRSEHDH
jgi:GH15 family glucan-1,4-alpha-glucosidase